MLQRGVFAPAALVEVGDELFFAHCEEKLSERERRQRNPVHLSDGKTGSGMDLQTEERSGDGDMAFGLVLAEVFQRSQSGGGFLDFIQDDERFAGVDRLPRVGGKSSKNPFRVEVGKEFRHQRIAVAVDIDAIPVFLRAEPLQ